MKLFYRIYGDGPPLIILHGLYGSSDNWVTIARSISDKFTVILPDQRNHGQSPHSSIHDYNSMSEDLYELAGDLKLDTFFLAGHSMGGKAAINFALRWPEKLNGLLVADISPFVNEILNNKSVNQHTTILNAILSIDLNEITSRKALELDLASRIPDERTRGLIMKNIQRNPDNLFSWKINAPSLLKNLDKLMEGIETGISDYLQITGFPVFFLKGENSDYLPEKDFNGILRIFPSAEFIVVRGAGHWLHADEPEAVKKALLRLLDIS